LVWLVQIFGVELRNYSTLLEAFGAPSRVFAEISPVAFLANLLQQLICGGGGQRLSITKNPDAMPVLE
jgi:hypothetical protein